MNWIYTVDGSSDFWTGLIGVVVGGLLTGFFSIYSINKIEKNQRAAKVDADNKAVKSLQQAIHDEIEAVYDRYQSSMGAQIETLQEGFPLLLVYPIGQDYFSIYNGNALAIGQIDDHDLRRLIVRTYVLSKGLIDSYRMNNELLAKFEYWNLIAQETNSEIHKLNVAAHHARLVEYSKQLKKLHIEAKESFTQLMRAFNKIGVIKI